MSAPFLAWNAPGWHLSAAGWRLPGPSTSGLGAAPLPVAVPAITLGGLIGIASYRRWQANARSMRLGRPLGDSPLPAILVLGIVGLAVIICVLVELAALTG
jgi:uncharacterized membrane protein YidH (DUF202 family)